jgi:hypothetical protein
MMSSMQTQRIKIIVLPTQEEIDNVDLNNHHVIDLEHDTLPDSAAITIPEGMEFLTRQTRPTDNRFHWSMSTGTFSCLTQENDNYGNLSESTRYILWQAVPNACSEEFTIS